MVNIKRFGMALAFVVAVLCASALGEYVREAWAAFVASTGSAAAPSITFSGQTTDGWFSKSSTQVGETINGVEVGFFNSLGDRWITNQYKTSKPCDTGYTRVGLWCYDTDGSFTLIRSVTTADSGFVTVSTGNSEYRAAILSVHATLLQDGTAEYNYTTACTRPGDSGQTNCNFSGSAAVVTAVGIDANYQFDMVGQVITKLDGSGQVKTKCQIWNSAALTSHQCVWFLVAYLDN